MFNFDLTYIIANLILFIVFVISGRKIANNNDLKIWTLFCIIIYTTILGLRYARGYDYFHYIDLYLNGYDEGEQKIFVFINYLLKKLGVGQYYIFVVYSLIEILCSFIFLKRYRNFGVYIIPLFMISTISFNEYSIRQALGFSFVWLCIANTLDLYNIIRNKDTKKIFVKLIKVLLFFTLSYSIHSVDGYLCIIMILIIFFSREPIPLKVSVPLLIFATYFFSRFFDFSWLNIFLNLFAGDQRMAHYINNYDTWFSFDDYHDEITYTRNGIVLVFEMVGCISLLYFGKKTIINIYHKHDAIAFYNFFVLGVILLNAFREVELLQRAARCLYIFWFFPLAIVLCHKKQIVKSSPESYMYLFLIWWSYDYLKYLFFRGEMTKFIWDI